MSTTTTFSGTYSVYAPTGSPGNNLIEGTVPSLSGMSDPLPTEADHDSFAKSYADFIAVHFGLSNVHLAKSSTTTISVDDPNFYVTGG